MFRTFLHIIKYVIIRNNNNNKNKHFGIRRHPASTGVPVLLISLPHTTLCSKKGDTKLTAATLLILDRFSNFFFTDVILHKFAAKYLLKIPPHVICVAALPCETLMSENERQSQTNAVINDKLPGTVVTLHIYSVVGLSTTKLRKVYY